MAKPDSDPIKHLLKEKTTLTKPKLSPIDYINRNGNDLQMLLTERFKSYTLETPSPTVYESLLSNVETFNMETNLGNSANRSKKQMEEGQQMIQQQLDTTDINTMIAFTDGSALSNPGPTGAGAAILSHGQHSSPTKLANAVDHLSNNFHGEI